ncbi:hypothetical protein BN2476_120048 [Paraburkholderia piptadeniae]|uniref:Uncharacterized protein n=1 Tax=Paraburkholderia piptadeniae TaxID=1701573 RepID=A0A1N7RR19_9BURK|nr:hypothetical protein BN2476_120048 [Paraburkholderia piptadeniae]
MPLACIAGLTRDDDHLYAASVGIGNDAAWRGAGRPDIHQRGIGQVLATQALRHFHACPVEKRQPAFVAVKCEHQSRGRIFLRTVAVVGALDRFFCFPAPCNNRCLGQIDIAFMHQGGSGTVRVCLKDSGLAVVSEGVLRHRLAVHDWQVLPSRGQRCTGRDHGKGDTRFFVLCKSDQRRQQERGANGDPGWSFPVTRDRE